MSHRRLVFLDIDGTIAHQGVVPAAHVEAIRAARAAGHVVLVCTGRCSSIVAQELQDLTDGAVTSAGAHVRLGQELLRDERFAPQLARRAVELLVSSRADFVLEGPEGLYGTETMVEYLRARARETPLPGPGTVGRGSHDLADAAQAPEDLGATSFAKISLWSSEVPILELAEQMGSGIEALPSSMAAVDGSSGELFQGRIDKADGLRMISEALGEPMDATVGIGDGMNDLGMLRAAGTAIAIEGAPRPVLEAADATAPGPTEHGLVEAFTSLGLI